MNLLVLFDKLFYSITLLSNIVSSFEIRNETDNVHVNRSNEQINEHVSGAPPPVPFPKSAVYLTQLAHAEQSIHRYLVEYEIQLQKRLEILQRLRTDYEDSVLAAITSEGLDEWLRSTVVSSHPILSYRMIRRFAKDFTDFNEHIWQSLENELWENLEKVRANFAWPSQEDLMTATKSLITLQDIHDFDLSQFTNGVMRDNHIKVGLTARQCLEICETALELGNANAAAEWFQAAHFKGVNGLDNSLSIDDLTQAWGKTYQAFQRIWPMQIFETHDIFKEAKLLLQNDFNRRKSNLTQEHISVNFKALCRGEQLLTEKQVAELQCFLENKIHPYYYLNPLRIEIYNWQPLLYKVHNFVHGKYIMELSSTVVPVLVSMMESGTSAFQTNSIEKTYTYISLPDVTSTLLATLTHRIDSLPGLNVFQFQTMPSVNYTVSAFASGYHYEPCVRCFEMDKPINLSINSRGMLVSSVHIMLHEPEKGGELAFPMLGVSVTPSIGSAIVYNEIDAFGNAEKRIIHGGCPVLIGEKWMATKFVYTKY